jgi:hypothetical protein
MMTAILVLNKTKQTLNTTLKRTKRRNTAKTKLTIQIKHFMSFIPFASTLSILNLRFENPDGRPKRRLK